MPPVSGRAPSPWEPSRVGVNHDVTVDIIRGLMNKQGFLFAVIWRRRISSIDATDRRVRLRTVILEVRIPYARPTKVVTAIFIWLMKKGSNPKTPMASISTILIIKKFNCEDSDSNQYSTILKILVNDIESCLMRQ